MEIVTETTDQDHIDFYRDYGFKRNWIQRALILLLIDIVLSAFEPLGSFYLINLLVIGILLSPFFFLIPFYRAKARFEKAYGNLLFPNATKIYKPFASGIEVTQEPGNCFLRYEDIGQVGAVGNFVFLISRHEEYYLLPKGCFSSEHEANHFLSIVTGGIAKVKGVKPKEPLTFKPVYLVGILCLIPLLGAVAGLVLIILGIVHYKDKVFIIIGSVGILITIAIYGSLFYTMKNSGVFINGFAEIAQTQLNDLVKNIEFYKLQNGTYPDSLQQIETKDSFVSIYDPLQTFKGSKKSVTFQYQRKGNKYLLFSVGKDGKPNTADDIYPTLTNPDTSKLGFIRK